jgi:hypothetical protein
VFGCRRGGAEETQYLRIWIVFYHPSPDCQDWEVLAGGANTVGPSFGAPISAAAASAAFSVSGDNNNNATNDNKLSVDSALNNLITTPAPLPCSQMPPQQASLSVLYPPLLRTRASPVRALARLVSDGMRRAWRRFGRGWGRSRLPVPVLLRKTNTKITRTGVVKRK